MDQINQNLTHSTALPEEIKGWNWGAFLLNWIWGIGNQTWIALLTFIPVFGLIWMLVLGAKGNQWAWEKGRWHSVEQFKRVQRKWAIAGFIFWGVLITFGTSVFFIALSAMHNSWVVKTSLSTVQQNTHIQQRLGTPITRSWLITGGFNSNANGTGQAIIQYHIKGPKGSAKVYAAANKKDHQWTMLSLVVNADHGDKIIINGKTDEAP